MEGQDELTLGDIHAARSEGELFAELQDDRRYALILYEIYPNGTSSRSFIEDREVVAQVGELTGLGPPTDTMGWGIWLVDEVAGRKRR